MARPRRQARGVFANANINQDEMSAWLDVQEQNPFFRVARTNRIVRESDFLDYEPYDGGVPGQQGRGAGIRRTIIWRIPTGLTKPLWRQMLSTIKYNVRTRHKINLRYAYELRNIETNATMSYYTNRSSHWMERLSQTQAWLQEQDELRLQGENIDRPDTKWVFERHLFIDLKVILDRQPLQIGLGRLPDWLRNKREVISLDTFNDALCLFWCVAVHRGAHIRDNRRRTRELAQSFFAAHPKFTAITLQQFHLLERHFKQGIAAYSVTNDGDFVLSYTPSRYDKVGPSTMTIGLYEGHAFLITDINKVTNNYTCGECMARFTWSNNLNRHIKTGGRANISCSGNRILAPESAFEKAFYPEGSFGIKATCWLEYVARQTGTHIHHHRCGHGGERLVAGEKVDGYHPETKTVFQFHGCFWHGCIKCFPKPEQKTEVICIDRKGNEITREDAYQKTLKCSEVIRFLGYRLVEKWKHEGSRPWWYDRLPTKRNETYLHAIVYDFEAYQDKTKASNPTRDLSLMKVSMCLSQSLSLTH